jgi:hypothetical protein
MESQRPDLNCDWMHAGKVTGVRGKWKFEIALRFCSVEVGF